MAPFLLAQRDKSISRQFGQMRHSKVAAAERSPKRPPNTLVVISHAFDIVTTGGIQMAVECTSAPHMGVFSTIELDLLRGVVREILRSGEAELDNEDAEMIARAVIATYKDGASGREELLEAARIAARRCALDHFYDRAVGLFA
ncbi:MULTISPECIES: hypothetical protein [unclassified Mesorhizobium]|uniref:hypothetical protein n=1 Tax=unclassified Mesorhizobium TaxID=325217 RepID=UPI000FD37EB7|nr:MULTISPECIES: hypothetical protein [unclassified Mesorhizobium]RVB73195.1 hypothetical protein EN885_27020 [Mesorhizobium sp. M6A.T.Cr.TU.014.01.1.1]RWP95780.1 MAG: hypothetical protein EOR91_32025 [Mesorhizobium sp.]RWQ00383.1 MAG: hypothetical protein EOR90_22865 [Mesorhizobium sp.]